MWALLGTLALHGSAVGVLVLLTALGMFDRERPEPPKPPPQAVGLRNLSAEDWAQNRGEAPPPSTASDPQRAQAPRAPPKPRTPEDRPEGQVVDVAPGNGETDPESKYLAETSNRAQKQTRAKEQTPFYRNAMPQATTTTPQSTGDATAELTSPEGSGNEGLGDDDRPLLSSERKLAVEVPDVKAADEVKLDAPPKADGQGPQIANRSESLELKGNSRRLRLVPGSPSESEEGSQGRAGAPGKVNLMPSLSVLDSVIGGAPNDHLDEEVGDGTYLSTREWKYASFFNRVKQSIGMTWNPSVELRRRDPTGSMYGQRDRHTVLSITLDQKGMIKDLFVAKSCGLDFLDLEAIRSFERAQPFPNPPPGLMARDATVSFQFGFFVQMDGGMGRTRMFRRQ